MSLFSESDKSELESIIDEVHDSFKVLIYAHFEPTREVINTNTNPFYSHPADEDDIVFTERKVEIYARILQGKPSWEYISDGSEGDDSNLRIPSEQVRLKILASDYNTVKNAKRFEINGRFYVVASTPREHGLFSERYVSLYVRPIEIE